MAERTDAPHQAAPAFDPRANRTAALLFLGPAVFLLHFSAVYGLNAMVCRFGVGSAIFGLHPSHLIVLVATVLGVAVVLLAARGAHDVSTEGETEREYDLEARRQFVGKARVMVSWLAVAGMLLVAVTAWLTHPCT